MRSGTRPEPDTLCLQFGMFQHQVDSGVTWAGAQTSFDAMAIGRTNLKQEIFSGDDGEGNFHDPPLGIVRTFVRIWRAQRSAPTCEREFHYGPAIIPPSVIQVTLACEHTHY